MYTKEQMNSPEYSSWRHMKERCLDEECKNYADYGGRGIKICERWLDKENGFNNFYEDMGARPDDKSIDRIDVNGNYEPKNCRWATLSQQARNKRNTIKIKHKNKQKPLIDVCEKLKVDYESTRHRIQRLGWNFEKAAYEEPHNETRYFEDKDGKQYTVKELAKKYGMLKSVLSNRIVMGWNLRKALDTPVEDKEWEIARGGRTMNLKDWCEEVKLPYKAVHLRITRYGWDIEKALTTPLDDRYEFNGKNLTLAEWARETGIGYDTLRYRILFKNWPLEKAFTKPLSKNSKVYKGV